MNHAQIIDGKIRSIVQRERDALAELLKEIRELDAIHGYIELGFQNLFHYLTDGVGYSAGSAQRRIDAARLSREVPSLCEKLQSGAIGLQHVTAVAKAVRQASKKRKVSAEEKCEIFENLERKADAQTQKEVAQYFDLQVITGTKRTVQKDGSVRYEITVSKETDEVISQAQALASHAVPTNNLADFLEYCASKIVKQKAEPARKYNSTATVAVDSGSGGAVPERLHREVRHKQPACAECGTSWFPQTDHKRSRWKGGANLRENLQTLCGPCNRLKFRREEREARGYGSAPHL